MSLKLIPPRPGKTPNYTVRGTYLRVYVERTAGTPDKKLAGQVLKGIERAIERGEYAAPQKPAVEAKRPATFADAALAYLRAGGEAKYLSDIIELTGEHALRDKPLTEIDQIAIDNAASALYPDAPATTTNRQFYTPVSAALQHPDIQREVHRTHPWRRTTATTMALPL